MAAGIPLRRTRDILLEAALPVAASVYILLVAHNFLGAYVSFLTLLAKVLAPWAAVFGVDTLRHLRRDYRLQELYRGAQSDYGKLRLQELAAWLVGIAAALLTSSVPPLLQGPFAVGIFQGSNFGLFLGFLVRLLTYLPFSRAD